MLNLLVATQNPGKIKEIDDMLSGKYLRIQSLTVFPEFANLEIDETGATYQDNALLKARTYGRLSGLITLADDSGLSVAALGGRPGVHSKRYGDSDAQRIQKLLNELRDVPESQRQAHFTCCMVMYDPSADKYYTAEGRVDGSITVKPMGTHGFGYDPVFFCPELGKTFGQATPAEKNSVSHRFRALAGVKEIIRTHFT